MPYKRSAMNSLPDGSQGLAARTAIAILAMMGTVGLLASALFGVEAAWIAIAIALGHAALALPLYVWIARRREVRFRDVVFGGFLIGALPIQFFNLVSEFNAYGWSTLMSNANDPQYWAKGILVGVLLGSFGALAGSVFLVVLIARSKQSSPTGD